MFKDKIILIKNRNVLSIFLSTILFLFVFVISSTNVLYVFNKKIQDIYFQFNNLNISKNIVVVEIDEETLAGRKNTIGNITLEGLGRFPFDRKYHATVIDNLTNAGASVIALDMIFGEKSSDYSDEILSESIKKAGNVVLGLWTDSTGILQKPYGNFGDYMYNGGYLAPNIDTINKVVYSIKPFFKFRLSDNYEDHFVISIIRGFYSKIYNDPSLLTVKPVLDNKNVYIGNNIVLVRSSTFTDNELSIANKLLNSELEQSDIKIHKDIINSIDKKENILINYTESSKFFKKSYLDIYYNQFDKSIIKDKIVIIGATAKGIKDTFSTPLGIEYGVYTHANAINTILTNNSIKYLDKNIEWMLIYLLIIVSVYFNISKSSYVLILSNISLISIFLLFVLYSTIFTSYLLNFPVELAFAFIFSLVISNILKYYIENKHKTKLNKALSEYVSEDVANEILSGAGLINLNGEKKEIAIFFSDIEGFTSISEKLSPEELVLFLREYLGEMSNIIMSDKGYIDKYEGDAIMALWGVFGVDNLSTYRICNSALLQQTKLIELNKIWKDRGFGDIKARIGIHFGSAVVGDIGSEGGKKNFTALGDNVNLASRLEGVNKFYGTFICVSETIYDLQNENFEFRYLDKIRVKGKIIPIKIYELLGKKGEVTQDKLQIKYRFENATKLYLNREFVQAKEIFQSLLDIGDKAARIYLEMCEIYIKNSPPDEWDGVSEMLSK
ncbi:MAG: adenylate/guanylate cyclase domain-containing protein [Candidatus Gracilibacteria bacterium]|nr:adenylate/guanylate cyclase domain-containing protein [Candidatus Gracilibacteria bacterium]